MVKYALFARLKPTGKERCREILETGLTWPSKNQQRRSGSPCDWGRQHSAYLTRSTDEAGLLAHMKGPIAQALMAQASELLTAAIN